MFLYLQRVSPRRRGFRRRPRLRIHFNSFGPADNASYEVCILCVTVTMMVSVMNLYGM